MYSEKLLMVDRGTVRNMYRFIQNKSEKFVPLVGFIIRIQEWLTEQKKSQTSRMV
jgi:hypothetical protein